jgi:hypothetical protein
MIKDRHTEPTNQREAQPSKKRNVEAVQRVRPGSSVIVGGMINDLNEALIDDVTNFTFSGHQGVFWTKKFSHTTLDVLCGKRTSPARIGSVHPANPGFPDVYDEKFRDELNRLENLLFIGITLHQELINSRDFVDLEMIVMSEQRQGDNDENEDESKEHDEDEDYEDSDGDQSVDDNASDTTAGVFIGRDKIKINRKITSALGASKGVEISIYRYQRFDRICIFKQYDPKKASGLMIVIEPYRFKCSSVSVFHCQ